MYASQETTLENPVWHALQTEHAAFAVTRPLAARYRADIIPFCSLTKTQGEPERQRAEQQLYELTQPGEQVYLFDPEPFRHPGFIVERKIPLAQMVWNGTAADLEPAPEDPAIHRLRSEQEISEMIALLTMANISRMARGATELGPFFGIRAGGELVAMVGLRVAVPGAQELSYLCTHPDHARRGYAAALIRAVLRHSQGEGRNVFLHAARNAGPQALYRRLGFEDRQFTHIYGLQRQA